MRSDIHQNMDRHIQRWRSIERNLDPAVRPLLREWFRQWYKGLTQAFVDETNADDSIIGKQYHVDFYRAKDFDGLPPRPYDGLPSR